MPRKPQNEEPTSAEEAAEGAGDTSGDAGASEVQEKMDDIQEQGFRGVKVDPTPNENYTVAGVTSGAPTPETDHDAAVEAAKAGLDASAPPRAGADALAAAESKAPADDDE